LKVGRCEGEISALLTEAAPKLISLYLCAVDMNIVVDKPFSKLQKLVIRDINQYGLCNEIDITKSPLLMRGGILSEFGNKIRKSWVEDQEII